jgi:23S rRNA (uracil1939-C5)-methyltransferase
MEDTQETHPIVLDLVDVAFGGDAIGRLDGEVVFVPFGLPGERVRAQLGQRKRDFARAELLEVLQAAPERVDPPCPYFGTCGGCQWQHATYPAQLAFKRKVVVDQLRRIGGFQDANDLVQPSMGMVEPWGYRNHVRFSLGRKYGDVGYTYRESHRLLRVDVCAIAHPAINDVLAIIQRRCAGLKAHQIAVRYGCNTGDLLVMPHLPMVPELESGQPGLTEELLDRRFYVSGAAFFQVNTRRERRELPDQLAVPWIGDREGWFSMGDLLALTVLDRLEAQPDDLVVDAYCGVGAFSALIAPRVREVIGVEEAKAAIKDAKRNCADLENVRFIVGKTEQLLPELEERIDAAVVDPARMGCSPAVIRALLDREPRRIVYVSCDPATLARDLRLLSDGGYRIEGVQPIDMFPQTHHVESVTTLSWG